MWEVKYRAHIDYDSKRLYHSVDIEVEAKAIARTRERAIWNIQMALYGEVSGETNKILGRMAAGMIENGPFKKGNIKTEGEYKERQIWAEDKETTEVKKYEFIHPKFWDTEKEKVGGKYEYVPPKGYWVK